LRSALQILLKQPQTTALAGGFFLNISQSKAGYLNRIVHPAFAKALKRREEAYLVKHPLF